MPRHVATAHRFSLYRAQFYLEPLPPSLFDVDGEGPEASEVDLIELFQAALLSTLSIGRPPRIASWDVGNFVVSNPRDIRLLYGRIGRQARRSGERYTRVTAEYKPKVASEDRSVAFLFEDTMEILAIESSPQISADLAMRRLLLYFNSAPAADRKGFKLAIFPVHSAESARVRLRKLRFIYSFSAHIRTPNPYMDDNWRKFYENLANGTQSDHQDVTWKSRTGRVNVDSPPIENTIEMNAAGYGEWEAKGKREEGRPTTSVASGQQPEQVLMDITEREKTMDAFADAFMKRFLKRT